jgi:hypothetical protein
MSPNSECRPPAGFFLENKHGLEQKRQRGISCEWRLLLGISTRVGLVYVEFYR